MTGRESEEISAVSIRYDVSNPVLTAQTLGHGDPLSTRAAAEGLLAQGIAFPPRVLRRLNIEGPAGSEAPPRAGVVGLVVLSQFERGVGLVTRIKAELTDAGEGGVAAQLPVRAERIQELLMDVALSGGQGSGHPVPEQFAFRIDADLELPMRGRSMDVAAALALLDAIDGRRSNTLSACAAVVAEEDGKLIAVDGIREKLEAFDREVGEGSLLIAVPGSAAEEVVGAAQAVRFREVWWVQSLEELACKLREAGLLSALTSKAALGRRGCSNVRAAHDALVESGHFEDAASLSARVRAIGVSEEVPVTERYETLHMRRTPLNNLGRVTEALEAAEEALEEARRERDLLGASPLLQAVLQHASALYNAHLFEAAHDRVEEALGDLDGGVGWLDADTRRQLLATSARSASVIGRHSLALERLAQARSLVERARLQDDRTLFYRCEALLRLGDLASARAALDQLREQSKRTEVSAIAPGFLAQYGAELDRRLGAPGNGQADPCPPGMPGWMQAYVLVAQRPDPATDPAGFEERMRLAATHLRSSPTMLLSMLARICDVAGAAAALHEDAPEMARRLLEDLETDRGGGGAATWYGPQLIEVMEDPGPAAASALLGATPYFLGGRSGVS